ncbi:TPA: hypothetical protein HA278_05450 [Candidatus Woesearchaeota archaeon]|nr:hypothetical protein [Candidatus Woesearchaeota archaeon]
MPNWTENWVSFKGPYQDISKIEKHLQSDDNEEGCFDFHKILPQPDDLERGRLIKVNAGEDKKTVIATMSEQEYNWCIDNWGTKWNSCDPEIHTRGMDSDNITEHIVYKFNTAWCTPAGITIAIRNMLYDKYPEVEMHWFHRDEDGGFYYIEEIEYWGDHQPKLFCHKKAKQVLAA